MNKLSWLLWLGDVSGSLSGFFVGLCIILCVAGIVMFILGNVYLYDEPEDSAEYRIGKYLRNTSVRICLPVFIVFGIIACVLPSKDTVYLIAGSEAGEQVLKSPTGQKAIDAVNRYLDNMGHHSNDEDRNSSSN